MTQKKQGECRYFLTYSGVNLPLKLINPLEDADVRNRNTFFRGYFDEEDRLIACEKVVYGEVEMAHQYEYFGNGVLKRAEITADDEVNIMNFNESGQLL